MKKYISISIVLISLFCSVLSAEESVVTLNKKNFDDVIKLNQFVLVEFYAPWCGHCKRLIPEYEKAAQTLKGEAVLGKIDATVEEKLAVDFEIQGFPTLKFFKNGLYYSDYNGERTADAIVAWVKKMSGPSSTLISTKEEYDAFLAEKSLGHVVAFVLEESALNNFKTAADARQFLELSFGHVTNKDLIESLNQKPGTVVVFDKGTVGASFSEEFTIEALTLFFANHGYPRLEDLDLNQEFIFRVTTKGRPLVLLLTEENEKQSLDEQYAFAKKISESNLNVHFAHSLASKYPGLPEQWGSSGKVFPTAIILRFDNGRPIFTAFDEEKEITVDSVLQWIESCISGKECHSFLKSDPIPEKNDEPVKVIVGKTFKDIVYDETKDVVVEFYSPSCPHCKNIIAPYNEFAQSYEKDDSIVVGKLDATTNSFPNSIDVKGFPTIYLFKANDKSNPILFDKTERTAASFREFVEENRTPGKKSEEKGEETVTEKKDEL